MIDKSEGPFEEDRGPIEASWDGYRAKVVSSSAGETQLRCTRNAFFAGALTAWAYIQLATAKGSSEDEPTDAEIGAMDLLDQELRAFVAECELEAREEAS